MSLLKLTWKKHKGFNFIDMMRRSFHKVASFFILFNWFLKGNISIDRNPKPVLAGTVSNSATSTRAAFVMINMQTEQVQDNNGLQNKGSVRKHPVERLHKMYLEYKCIPGL